MPASTTQKDCRSVASFDRGFFGVSGKSSPPAKAEERSQFEPCEFHRGRVAMASGVFPSDSQLSKLAQSGDEADADAVAALGGIKPLPQSHRPATVRLLVT